MCSIQQVWGKSGLITSVSALYNRMETKIINGAESIGPNVSIQQQLLNSKLKLLLTSTLLFQYMQRTKLSQNQSLTFGCGYEIRSGTSLKIDYNLLRRSAFMTTVVSFQEQRFNITLLTNFSTLKKQKTN
jgi:hypothetical protein